LEISPFDRLPNDVLFYFILFYFILFIMNDRTIRTLCKKESANKVIKNYDNAKCEIKSHAHRRMQTCYHQKKLISDNT